MDSLSNLLSDRAFDEPAEVTAIKQYVQDTYQSTVAVQLREHDILIIVSSAALAARLRHDLPALKAAAETNKRLHFRITS